jgi:hypothetical protein
MFGEPPPDGRQPHRARRRSKTVWWESVGLTPLEVGRRSPCGARAPERFSPRGSKVYLRHASVRGHRPKVRRHPDLRNEANSACTPMRCHVGPGMLGGMPVVNDAPE